jgi:hypothetical protein
MSNLASGMSRMIAAKPGMNPGAVPRPIAPLPEHDPDRSSSPGEDDDGDVPPDPNHPKPPEGDPPPRGPPMRAANGAGSA